MENFTRRGFLGGIASAAAGALVISASDADIEAFAGVGHPVSVLAQERPFIASGHFMPTRLQVGQQLFDERGKVVAVVREVHLDREPFDATTVGDFDRKYMMGTLRMSATVVAV